MTCLMIEAQQIARPNQADQFMDRGHRSRRLAVRSNETVNAVTPMQIFLLRRSLPIVLALADQVADAFYEHFIRIDPAPRVLFAGSDMHGQGAKLIQAIASGVRAVDDHDDAAMALRQYHITYGVGGHHFRNAGVALAGALEHELGSRFTAELGDAYASASRWVGQAILQPPHPMAA
jgi:hemoglobin-like flavoprotein